MRPSRTVLVALCVALSACGGIPPFAVDVPSADPDAPLDAFCRLSEEAIVAVNRVLDVDLEITRSSVDEVDRVAGSLRGSAGHLAEAGEHEASVAAEQAADGLASLARALDGGDNPFNDGGTVAIVAVRPFAGLPDAVCDGGGIAHEAVRPITEIVGRKLLCFHLDDMTSEFFPRIAEVVDDEALVLEVLNRRTSWWSFDTDLFAKVGDERVSEGASTLVGLLSNAVADVEAGVGPEDAVVSSFDVLTDPDGAKRTLRDPFAAIDCNQVLTPSE